MRRTTLTAALGLTLVLTGCSTGAGTGSEEPTTAASGADGATTTDAAGGDGAGETAEMSDPVCAGFFQTGPVTLAERAEADRGVLEAGDVLDPASWGEIDLLSQRIEGLTADATGDQGALLERVNAPFLEASAAVLEDPEATPADPEITVPEIDVTDSAAAQDELLASCAG